MYRRGDVDHLRRVKLSPIQLQISKLIRRFVKTGKDLAKRALPQPVVDLRTEWSQKLGHELSIGSGTSLNGANLIAPEPTNCEFIAGECCDFFCLFYFQIPGARIVVGSRSYIAANTKLDCAALIEIGDDVLIAYDVLITDHDSHAVGFIHRGNDVCDALQGRKDWTSVKRAPVIIGSKSWIGTRAIILKGVRIGEGAIVAAGAVVTRDVASWTIVAGNPARVVRELTDEERHIPIEHYSQSVHRDH